MGDLAYDVWHSGHAADDDIATPWHDFAKANIALRELEGSRVLEIGCGRGGFTNYLAQQSAAPKKIFGCDYSESALEIARKRYPSEIITWQKEDIMSLSFESQYFDVIVSCETIEHVPRSAKAISELYRVLKPGGILLLTCPNYFNLFGIWCLYRWAIGKPFTEGGQPYVNYLLTPRVNGWLKKAGFKIEKFKSVDLAIPLRRPRHYYADEMPRWLRIFGHRTYYRVRK